ncbi:tetratricopeptide repeat protein [Oceanobacillus salinisoli]|uniref:tetratricopeptide repeat protein n=1 Tax=Oceanobacillus salinisoli TaxID=2678611 RepID=UPI0012E1D155|nr:tetratricopeptide repeat protein [Oceanobacillus salinisoli]
MQTHHDKVILFPKWKKTLEEESLNALKDKEYEKALVKLNKLLSYEADNHEIITGKLICLMELGRFNEAQDLCEKLLHKPDENYYHYVHIYLTLLFQTNQYDLLMEQVEEEFEKHDIPKLQKEQFKQLYEISKKMKLDVTVEKKTSILQELFQAVEDQNFEEQWRQVEKLRSLHTEPSNQVIELLVAEHVHPLTKTAIIQWLKEHHMDAEVEIYKFDVHLKIVPAELDDIKESKFVIEIQNLIRDIEQQNPSLYQLLIKLLYDYAYVLYPIMPPEEDYIHIAHALEAIGDDFLSISPKNQQQMPEKVNQYIDKITMSESLYLSIIEG